MKQRIIRLLIKLLELNIRQELLNRLYRAQVNAELADPNPRYGRRGNRWTR